MAKRKENPERAELVLKLVRLRARGRTPDEMARECGVERSRVYDLLRKADKEATEARPETEVAAHRARVWAELREVKAEAWAAYEGSKVRMEFDADGEKLVIEDNPDPRYLGVVVQCIKDERDLYGLDVPVVKEVNHTGQFDFRAFFAAVPDEVPDTVTRDIYTLPPPLNEVASNDPPSQPPSNGSGAHLNGKNGKH